MKKLFTLILLSKIALFCSDIQASYAIGIFHENGTGENIQHKNLLMEIMMEFVFQKL